MDIIICTYNRPAKVLGLVKNILACVIKPKSIIIIDSSDEINDEIKNLVNIIYCRSNHKNQPYQRYLGVMHAKSDYILFLDDDMVIIDSNFLVRIRDILEQESADGLALNFNDRYQDTTLAAVPNSLLFNNLKGLKKIKNWATGYPDLDEGKLGFCGNRGKQPLSIQGTEYVSGGAFIAKRSKLFQNFNFQLFDLFEQGIGMGEDALIGYGIHKQGKLLFVPEVMFVHDDQKDSTYSANIYDYAKRVLFSRLYLSLEKTRIDNSRESRAKIHFYWYAFWRLTGLFFNFLIKSSSKRKKMLFGSFKGLRMAVEFQFCRNLQRNQYWMNEIEKNSIN